MNTMCLQYLTLFFMGIIMETKANKAEGCNEEGSHRLVGVNASVVEGRLEVCQGGIWNTVCDDYINNDVAKLVCRHLGLPDRFAFGIHEYGGGSGQILLLICIGDEENITQCQYLNGSDSCSHYEDVAIRCQNESHCGGKSVRLAGGLFESSGRVELCVDGYWYSLCSDGWDYTKADIVCQQLNYDGAEFLLYDYGLGTTHEIINVECNGSEDILLQCQLEMFARCIVGYAGVVCKQTHCGDGSVILVGGEDLSLGRVEYCHEGKWYTLCADTWNDVGEEARVICESLEYNPHYGSAIIDYYGRGENPVLPQKVKCNKKDNVLSQCLSTEMSTSHCSRIAGVVCEAPCNTVGYTDCHKCNSFNSCFIDFAACGCSSDCFKTGQCCADIPATKNCIMKECDSGAVRLVGGESDLVGALEVCVSGVWGGVCVNSANSNIAKVVCKQLKYVAEGASFINTSNETEVLSPILGVVECFGTEPELLQCRHNSIGYLFCEHFIEISCKGKHKNSDENDTRSSTSVVISVVSGTLTTTLVIVITTLTVAVLLYVHKKQRGNQTDVEMTDTRASDQDNVIQNLTHSQPHQTEHIYLAEPTVTLHTKLPQIPNYYKRELTRKKFIVDRGDVFLLECIGEGEFGRVHKGKLRSSDQNIVVKTLKSDFDQVQIERFCEECYKMSQFNHSHVMSLIGVCLETSSSPYIIMPYMANGSLLGFLRHERESLVLSKEFDNKEIKMVNMRLVAMCHQIARGMAYLTAEKYIHRDLAARNCMIDEHCLIKISDFGMSEDVFERNYFKQDSASVVKLPMKWMAPESLSNGVFSEKTDVWSYGVTMWEIFTGGGIPYPGIDLFDLVSNLEKGYRMPPPLNAACSEEMYDIMRQCWGKVPSERPTFRELCLVVFRHTEDFNPFTSFGGEVDQAWKKEKRF